MEQKKPKIKCPACGEEASKIIYLGLPMKFCNHCSTMFGFWSWVPTLWFNGAVFCYEGNYLRALWNYLRGK